MPALDFKGKSFIYTHHLGVPYRELLVVPEKSCVAIASPLRRSAISIATSQTESLAP